MSAIEKELSKATGVEAKRGEDRQGFLTRLVLDIAKLSDADWAKLSKPAQTWFNDAADARNDKSNADKIVPPFPDEEAEKPAPAARSSRRKVADEEDERLTKVGDTATVTTKRGKVYVGEVTEISSKHIVLKGDDGEDEFDMEKVESVVVQNGDAGGEDGPWAPAVGEMVVVTTKRGKKFEGEIIELSADELVLKDADGGEDAFDMDKVGSVEPLGAEIPAAEDDAPARRGSAKDDTPARRGAKADDAPADKPKRASNPKGVSVGGRIREIMCEDMGVTAADVGKILKKEAIDFRETTLDMIFKDTTTVFDLLKANKKLK